MPNGFCSSKGPVFAEDQLHDCLMYIANLKTLPRVSKPMARHLSASPSMRAVLLVLCCGPGHWEQCLLLLHPAACGWAKTKAANVPWDRSGHLMLSPDSPVRSLTQLSFRFVHGEASAQQCNQIHPRHCESGDQL